MGVSGSTVDDQGGDLGPARCALRESIDESEASRDRPSAVRGSAVPLRARPDPSLSGRTAAARPAPPWRAQGLYEARAGFDTIGARAWLAQADAELRRSASDRVDDLPRDLAGETLSPQEYQVAMAASRASTRDIAASLFISPKTVEAHLTRIYRKLDVSSKAQLVAKLGSTDSVPGGR